MLRLLAETVLGDLEVIQRKKCEALITECVHQRDVIEKLVQADANSNMMEARSVLPIIRNQLRAGQTVVFLTAVFAMPASVEGWRSQCMKAWTNVPAIPEWLSERVRNEETRP